MMKRSVISFLLVLLTVLVACCAVPALGESALTVSMPDGPYYVGVSYPITVTAPGAASAQVRFVSPGNDVEEPYDSISVMTLDEAGTGVMATAAYSPLHEDIVISAEIGGQVYSQTLYVDYVQNTEVKGPRVTLDSAETRALIGVTVPCQGAETVLLQIKGSDGQLIKKVYTVNDAELFATIRINDPGEYQICCALISGGVCSAFGDPVSFTVLPLADAEVRLPDTLQTGRDATIDYTAPDYAT